MNKQHEALNDQLELEQLLKRPGIPSCATKPVASDAAAVPESHLPAASADE